MSDTTGPRLTDEERETWRREAQADIAHGDCDCASRRVLALLDDLTTLRAENARLATLAAEMETERDTYLEQRRALADMLRRFEWLATNDGALECAACGQTPHQDHTADCSLRAVLSVSPRHVCLRCGRQIIQVNGRWSTHDLDFSSCHVHHPKVETEPQP